MSSDETIEYRNFDIEVWQALVSGKWFYLVIQHTFVCEGKPEAFDTKEEALTSARARIDFLILIDSQ